MDFLEYKRLQRLKASPTSTMMSAVTKVVYPDVSSDAEVGSLEINCIHSEEGCRWRDQLKSLQAHLNVCKWDAVLCPAECAARIPRVCMEDHLTFTCPKRMVKCDFCHQDFTGEQMEDHVGNCNYELVHCESKCGALLQRRFLSNHLRNECHKRNSKCQHCLRNFVHDTLQSHFHHCPRFPVVCPNRCPNSGKIPRDELEKHVVESCPSAVIDCPFRHAGCGFRGSRQMVEQHVDSDSKSHLKLMCGLVSKQRHEIEDLRQQMESTTRCSDGTLLWKISNVSQLLRDARQSPATKGEVVSTPFYTHQYGYKLVASVFPNGDGDGAEGKFLSLYVKILPGDYDNLLDWPFVHPIKFTLVDQSGAVGGPSPARAASATPTKTSTSSPSSPASPSRGVGASSTAVDDRLQHIEERFDPDPNWKTFQRPSRDATAADCLGYGYPKYVSHDVLLNEKRNYLVDDCVFIRIQVDLSYSHMF